MVRHSLAIENVVKSSCIVSKYELPITIRGSGSTTSINSFSKSSVDGLLIIIDYLTFQLLVLFIWQNEHLFTYFFISSLMLSQSNWIFINQIIEGHITIKFQKFIKGKASFQIDTVNYINMIKLLRRDEILVDKIKYYQLKGINDLLVNTTESVTLDVQMSTEKISSQFQIVKNNFSIPHDGVLENSFIEDNVLHILLYKRLYYLLY